MFKPKRINITLNARQIGDAQILAALKSLGGESASVLKALVLRGIMSDTALFATLVDGIGLMVSSRNTEGCGFMPPKVPKTVPAHPAPPIMKNSPLAAVSVADIKVVPHIITQQPPIIPPTLVPSSQSSLSTMTKTPTVAPASLSDFLKS